MPNDELPKVRGKTLRTSHLKHRTRQPSPSKSSKNLKVSSDYLSSRLPSRKKSETGSTLQEKAPSQVRLTTRLARKRYSSLINISDLKFLQPKMKRGNFSNIPLKKVEITLGFDLVRTLKKDNISKRRAGSQAKKSRAEE